MARVLCYNLTGKLTGHASSIPIKNNIDKIFQRFYRVDETGKKFHGLGIGLYVAEDIIQRHNGKIWVESELGKGSTFYFELPIT